ncbi:hypothetical protein [Rhodopirellula baltica]|uniref:Uncharacterized protein n=1 Tax=Rhodopirellula baltica SWK14 TaxID=993516 RepID=L7C6Y2_RHOBT|nr:hypothetical protein [Rhodopirellula baltica]ELP29555.1 hypothetical protein RBSWK_06528 [Rhodopirellula baltica SWK14]
MRTLLLIIATTLPMFGCGPTQRSFPTTAEVPDDSHLLLPPEASDIVLTEHGGFHTAVFTCPQSAIERFITNLRSERPFLNGSDPVSGTPIVNPDDDSLIQQQTFDLRQQEFAIRFGNAQAFHANLLSYGVALSRRGGNLGILFDPNNSRCYLYTAYR